MAQIYFDGTIDAYNVFVMNADTNELITTLPVASVPINSSSGFKIIPIGVAIPYYSKLWTDVDWAQCDPPPVGFANTTEMATAMCTYFPSQVITLNFP